MKILVINPGSTSTKLALFEDEKQLFSENLDLRGIDYSDSDGAGNLEKLRERVIRAVESKGYDLRDIDAYAGRGGKMVPCGGGVYTVNDKILEASDIGQGRCHANRYSPHLVRLLSQEFGGQAYVMNTQSVDELDIRARFTGFAGVWRTSGLHVLNHKEVGARIAEKLGKRYDQANLIIGHLGGGISVAAHRQGKIVDFSGGNGEGPIAPTRCGTVAVGQVVEMAFSGKYTKQDMMALVRLRGGMSDHLHTGDARKVEKQIVAGDVYAERFYDAMIYQIAKHIAALAVIMEGKVDAIVLTGGMANSRYLTEAIEGQVGWIAPVHLMPGEFEMEGMCNGILRVLRGQEQAVTYTDIPTFDQAQMEALREKSLAQL